MQQIEEMSDADIAEVEQSAALFRDVEKTTAPLRGLLNTLCGVNWLAAGMKKRQRAEFETPLQGIIVSQGEKAFSLLSDGPDSVDAADPVRQHTTWPDFTQIWRDATEIAGRENFLHWEAAFPGVWRRWQDDQPAGGFDAIIGNPPWDQIEQAEVEWFAFHDEEIADADTAAERKALIRQRMESGDELVAEFQAARTRAAEMRAYAKASDHFPLLSGGKVNIYSLFVERAINLIKPDGIVGLLTPSGIYADKTAARFFRTVSTTRRVSGLFDFENRRKGTQLPPFFRDVDDRFKFCAFIFGGEVRHFPHIDCSFFLHDSAALDDPNRFFTMTVSDFNLVNPNTGTAPILRTRTDYEITLGVYERHPVLVDRSSGEDLKAWPVRYKQGLFNMTSDSHLFRTAEELDNNGFYPVQGNRWKKGEDLYLPLYQGRMIHQFDHRANSVQVNPESTHNPYFSVEVSETEHADPNFLPQTRYWVPSDAVEKEVPKSNGWFLAFRDVARTNDRRTMNVTVLPWVGCGHKVPLLLPATASFGADSAAFLIGNLNCISLDYVIRQKMQSTNVAWYIVEQLPVIAPADYDRTFGTTTARAIVRHHVLRLTYTAHDMAPFARDLGYDGPPFIWNEEERRHLRARLDALYFHLYGLSKDDAAYILDTFPIVRRHDKAAFGNYRTKAMVLAYCNALAAGDTDTDVAV